MTRISAFVFIVISIPCILLFRRSIDAIWFQWLTYPTVYCCLLPLIIVFLYRMLRSNYGKLAKFGFVSLVLVAFLSAGFGQNISVAWEIYRYNLDKDEFAHLVELVNDEPCYRSPGCYWKPSENVQNYLVDENQVFVIASRNSGVRLIAVRSRPNTYFTYSPDYSTTGEHYGGPYNVNCFHELDNGWFLCSIFLS